MWRSSQERIRSCLRRRSKKACIALSEENATISQNWFRRIVISAPAYSKITLLVQKSWARAVRGPFADKRLGRRARKFRSEEHTSELQSLRHLVCRLLLEKK